MIKEDGKERYTEEEARRRSELTLRAALNTPPQPLKQRPPRPRKDAAKPQPKWVKPSA